MKSMKTMSKVKGVIWAMQIFAAILSFQVDIFGKKRQNIYEKTYQLKQRVKEGENDEKSIADCKSQLWWGKGKEF